MDEKEQLNVTVIGGGYVGIATACMFSKKHHVVVFDIDNEKVEKINKGISPIEDVDVKDWLLKVESINLRATSDKNEAYENADIALVAVPTNFDENQNSFDTSLVSQTIEDIININSNVLIVIRSTVPIGFTQLMREKTGYERILFNPEFLREGRALKDILSPSRVIIGTDKSKSGLVEDAETYLKLVADCLADCTCPKLIANSSEAEAIKLFSNSYLAMRIAFFNELDSFAESQGLDSKEIIAGLGFDSRIGDYYNNPSFGYGGYCLPKDIRQLQSEYDGLPQAIFTSVIDSNDKRIDFIVEQILKKAAELSCGAGKDNVTIGVYRLNMKKDSDNYRQSATAEVLRNISGKGYKIVLFEPLLNEGSDLIPDGCVLQNNCEQFKNDCTIIVANRYASCLDDVKGKVYTRALFSIN